MLLNLNPKASPPAVREALLACLILQKSAQNGKFNLIKQKAGNFGKDAKAI